MLAGLLKGPNFFNPDRRPERAKERLAYVLGRMQEDGVISPEQRAEALAGPPKIVALDRQRRDTGFHFVDFLGREAKADGIEPSPPNPTRCIRPSTPPCSAILKRRSRKDWRTTKSKTGTCSSIGQEHCRRGAKAFPGSPFIADQAPPQRRRGQCRLAAGAGERSPSPLPDVHWERAVVLRSGKRADKALRVGLADGRILPLTTRSIEDHEEKPQCVRCRLCPGDRG